MVRHVLGSIGDRWTTERAVETQGGWNRFSWFRDNQLSCVVTAGIIAGVLVMILKGFQKRTGIQLENPPAGT